VRMVFDASVLEMPFTGIAKTSLLLYRECLVQQPGLTVTGLHRKTVVGEVPAGVALARGGSTVALTVVPAAGHLAAVEHPEPVARALAALCATPLHPR